MAKKDKKHRPMSFEFFVARLHKEGFLDDSTAFHLTRGNYSSAKKELVYQMLLIEMFNRSRALQQKLFDLLPEKRRNEIWQIVAEAEDKSTKFAEGEE